MPILAPLAALWRVLTAKPSLTAIGALIALCGFMSLRLAMIDGDRDKWRDRAGAEKLAHETTVTNYRAAAAEAERIMAANVARVKAEQAAISERTIDELETARASADARYRRLLASAAEADTRRAADADLSAATDAACLAYGAARCDELPAKLRAAQDNTDQLIALQDWVREQALIVTSPTD